MAERHERYEELALGHVLGGLNSSESASFRAHLVECRDCRLRVAELRDIAAELAATEREERRRAAVQTQVARRESGEETRSWLRWTHRLRTVLLVVVVSSVLAILFWNYHLRHNIGVYAKTVDKQAQVLEVLASGDALSVDAREGTRGQAAIRGRLVAVDIDRLPELPPDSDLVIWLLGGREAARIVHQIKPPPAGLLPFSVDVGEAELLVITAEKHSSPKVSPGVRELVRVRLRKADPTV